jgi:hypothetical protein
MANYTFRGLDERAVAIGDVPMTLDGVDPPLELPQLLELRRGAAALLRSDERLATATVLHA